MAKRAKTPRADEVVPPDFEQQMVQLLTDGRRYLVPVGVGALVLIIIAIVVIKSKDAAQQAVAQEHASLSTALGDPIMAMPGPEEDPEEVTARTKKEYDARLTRLQSVIAAHPGTNSAIEAEFYAARTHYDMGDYDAAAKAFGAFATSHPSHPPLSAMAAMGEANCLVNLEKYQDAYNKFVALSTSSHAADVNVAARAKYRAALCAVTLSKKDEARKLVEDILASSATEELKDKAQALQDKIDVLDPTALQRPPEKTEEEKAADEAAKNFKIEGGGGGLQISPNPAN